MSVKKPPKGLTGFLFGDFSEYVSTIKPLFIICIFLFVFSLVIGYSMGDNISQEQLEELLGGFPDPNEMDVFGLLSFIIINNVSKSLVFMLAGFIFGIPSLFFTVLNGFFIGWIVLTFGRDYGFFFVTVGLLPHGIIEIPAILLSMAMGMGLGYSLINRLRGRGGLIRDFRSALGFYMRTLVPMLFLSAVIEVTITPFLISLISI
jgi:stage II sporulation protein M